ncbi:MAG TPA: BON domain-containing protein [Burkholderiales bacterium]|jgi:osmotically-inducible protein OsmY
MKRIAILASALFLAAPAIAQDKSTTREPSTNPNPNVQSDTRSNADMPSKTDSPVPTAEDRSKNRDAVSGAALTGKVKSALAADVGLKTVTSIDVDSDKGIVTLKGKVESAEQKKRAEMVAKKVSGVKSVKNQLTVSGG